MRREIRAAIPWRSGRTGSTQRRAKKRVRNAVISQRRRCSLVSCRRSRRHLRRDEFRHFADQSNFPARLDGIFGDAVFGRNAILGWIPARPPLTAHASLRDQIHRYLESEEPYHLSILDWRSRSAEAKMRTRFELCLISYNGRLTAVPLTLGRGLTSLFWEMSPPVSFFFIALMLIFVVVKLLALQY
jgi:hypothetical protein